MSPVLRFTIAIVAALLLYLVTFVGMLSRPNTSDLVFDMMAAKVLHARTQASPRMLVVAGSNGRFSHSCAVFAAELARPCTNMAIHWGVGMDFMLDATLALIRPGDLVYVPMEYPGFAMTRRQILDSEDAGDRLRRDPRAVFGRGPEGVLRAAFSFDLPYLVRALFEMATGPRADRRMLNSVNAQGDAIGHTTERAAQFHALIQGARAPAWRVEDAFPPGARPNGAADMIAAFLRDATAKGGVVIGGLPTTFDDVPVAEDLVAAVAAFYRANDAAFVALPGRSQYPRDWFYDTAKHLTLEAQQAHSRRLVPLLRALLVVQSPIVERDASHPVAP